MMSTDKHLSDDNPTKHTQRTQCIGCKYISQQGEDDRIFQMTYVDITMWICERNTEIFK